MKTLILFILSLEVSGIALAKDIKTFKDVLPGTIESVTYLSESGYWVDSSEANFKFEDKSVSPALVTHFNNEALGVELETELKGLCGCEGSYTLEKLKVRSKSGKVIQIIINECGAHGYKKGVLEIKKKRYDVYFGDTVEAILKPVATEKRKSILKACGS